MVLKGSVEKVDIQVRSERNEQKGHAEIWGRANDKAETQTEECVPPVMKAV